MNSLFLCIKILEFLCLYQGDVLRGRGGGGVGGALGKVGEK